MNSLDFCDILRERCGELFTCSTVGEYQRIRTPFLYPDGDIVDLFCKEEVEGVIAISDLGETTRWLRMQTASPKRSKKQLALIKDICQTHGVEFFRGMILARYKNGDDFAMVLNRVAQAVLRVSDIWFTFRTRSVQSVNEEVAEYLQESRIPFERGERLIGRSGRLWTVDFHVRAPERSSLVNVLVTGSRSAARGVAEHVLSEWYDLNQLAVGAEALTFISLFDDTVDVWAEEDFRLVGQLSEVLRWSEPDSFMRALQAA